MRHLLVAAVLLASRAAPLAVADEGSQAAASTGARKGTKIPKAKLTALLRGAGFSPRTDDPDLLPYQLFLVFEKPASGSARGR